MRSWTTAVSEAPGPSSSAAAGAEGAPIDPAVADSLRRLGERSGRDVFGELTTLFLSTADTQLDTAHELLARGDYGELARVAHALKGSSSVIGGRRVAAAAAALESTAVEAQPEGAEDCTRSALRRFTEELELFRRAVRSTTTTE
jgi:HPt (histidine-containing phosphotransfer) domain-containing protein